MSSPDDIRPVGGKLTTWQIAVLISAAAAPLGGVVGTGPIGVIFGNGAGLPGIFLIAGVIMALFGIGYTALIRAIPGEGAFYRYLSAVFGPSVGNGAAGVAMLTYLLLTTAVAIGTAYFTDFTLAQFGLHLGFPVWVAIFIAVVGILGRSAIDIAAKVVVPMIIVEFLLLLALVVAIAFHRGVAAFPPQAFAPVHVFGSGAGVSLMVALGCFIGVESAALYSAEAKSPDRSVPRATLIAIAVVSVIYLATFWAVIGDLGVSKIPGIAAAGQINQDIQQGLILQLFGANIGITLQGIVGLMLCTSNLACFIALHNAASRYVHTLGLHGILPVWLSVKSKAGAPARASAATTAFEMVTVAIVILAHFDYIVAFAPIYALGATGIIILQAAVAFATVWYFSKRRDKRVFVTVIAPLASFIGFVVAGVMVALNYDLLAGTDALYVRLSPILFVIVFLIGTIRRRAGTGIATVEY
ncbi:APC family permease [Paraburkholderia sp. BL27I4N3]|uniref:APC family permease n=1 Tax=Paraburkholderia sp. BL27I4N3 TaxID=1938805 RepID=UPI0015F270F6|nr:APC family permease [Paraburkholderia sp. BL27I4N3]